MPLLCSTPSESPSLQSRVDALATMTLCSQLGAGATQSPEPVTASAVKSSLLEFGIVDLVCEVMKGEDGAKLKEAAICLLLVRQALGCALVCLESTLSLFYNIYHT